MNKLPQHNFQVVSGVDDSDEPYQMPASIQQEFAAMMFDWQMQRPVIHKIKEFIQAYPHVPMAGQLLANIYLEQQQLQRADEVNDRLLLEFPGLVSAVLFRAGRLLSQERYDELESFIDLNKSFAENFPGRSRVSLNDFAAYEILAVEWLLINMETDSAVKRTRTLLDHMYQFHTGVPAAERIRESFLDLVPLDEFTPGLELLMTALDRYIVGASALPEFHHPEMQIVFRKLKEEDVPALLALLELPRKTLLLDLRTAIRDGLLNFRYYQQYDIETFSNLVPIGFLLLAALEEPGELTEWVQFLKRQPEIVEWWMGDWMHQLMFVVGWQLGHNDLPALFNALKDDYRYDWATPNLVQSLVLTALHEPGKEKQVVDMLETLCIRIMEEKNHDVELSPFLTNEVLLAGCAFDQDRFLPYMRKAYQIGYMDAGSFGTEEQFMSEIETKEELYQGFHYKTSQQSLETWLRRVIKDELSMPY